MFNRFLLKVIFLSWKPLQPPLPSPHEFINTSTSSSRYSAKLLPSATCAPTLACTQTHPPLCLPRAAAAANLTNLCRMLLWFWNFVRASSIFTQAGEKKNQTNKLQLKFCKNGGAAREPSHSHGAAVGSDEQHRFYLQKKKSTVTLNRRAALFYYHFLKQRWTHLLIALRPNKEVQGCSAKTLFSLWIMNYRSSRRRRSAEVRM